MNKTELRDAVAAAADLNGTQADKAVNAVLDSIASALAAGDKVTLPGFGTFETRDRAARQGRNPRDGRRRWRSPRARRWASSRAHS